MKLVKGTHPIYQIGLCDDHLDEGTTLINEYINKINKIKIEFYQKIRNMK